MADEPAVQVDTDGGDAEVHVNPDGEGNGQSDADKEQERAEEVADQVQQGSARRPENRAVAGREVK